MIHCFLFKKLIFFNPHYYKVIVSQSPRLWGALKKSKNKDFIDLIFL